MQAHECYAPVCAGPMTKWRRVAGSGEAQKHDGGVHLRAGLMEVYRSSFCDHLHIRETTGKERESGGEQLVMVYLKEPKIATTEKKKTDRRKKKENTREIEKPPSCRKNLEVARP